MKLKYDLHIHSCLSPCCDDDMTPANIANMAMLAGLDVVALTDHNTARNCPAFMEAAGRAGLLALPGMELTTSEEVHILCLLPDLKAAAELDRYVYKRLPDIKNRPDIFGRQLVMDCEDRIIAEEDKLLLNSSSIGIYEISTLLSTYGGTAIPAHIDRSSFSVLSNLGAMPADLGFTVAEVTRTADLGIITGKHPELRGFSFIRNSDAHGLTDIYNGEYTIELDGASPQAVIKALRNCSGLPVL